jgi:hypothetical protein
MTLFDYVAQHPYWTLTYLLVGGFILIALVEAIRGN